MQNLNEIRPKKHKIVAEGRTVIETDNIDSANHAWKPVEGQDWEWFRNGESVKKQTREE